MDVLIEPVSAAMISVMWRRDDGFVTVYVDPLDAVDRSIAIVIVGERVEDYMIYSCAPMRQ
jgi:hypothetical protein